VKGTVSPALYFAKYSLAARSLLFSHATPVASDIPAYMGVVVTNQIATSGSTLAGSTTRIVVIKTDPGYAPDPGHPGMGTVVAQFCP